MFIERSGSSNNKTFSVQNGPSTAKNKSQCFEHSDTILKIHINISLAHNENHISIFIIMDPPAQIQIYILMKVTYCKRNVVFI